MRYLLIFLLLFLLNTNLLFSQENSYLISYSHVISFETHEIEASYNLVYTKKNSLYYKVESEFLEYSGNEVINANEGVVPFVKKDYVKNILLCNQGMFNKVKNIKEKLPLQKWKLSGKTKTIKSLVCYKATTEFRGRKYTAWYTEDLPILGGPWKFDGLPGLIVQISSDDGVLDIKAIKIAKAEEFLGIPTPDYSEDELITWDEYCEEYIKVIERIKKSMKADSEVDDVDYKLDLYLVEDIGLGL